MLKHWHISLEGWCAFFCLRHPTRESPRKSHSPHPTSKVTMHQKPEYYIKIGKAIKKESGMSKQSKIYGTLANKMRSIVMLLSIVVLISCAFYILAAESPSKLSGRGMKKRSRSHLMMVRMLRQQRYCLMGLRQEKCVPPFS